MTDARVMQGRLCSRLSTILRNPACSRRGSLPAVSPKRGGILAWLAIVFLMIATCVVVAGIIVARTIRVHGTHSGNNLQVVTPFGSIRVDQNHDGRPETAGMPLYPGAQPSGHGENASVDLSAFGNNNLHIVAGKWETPDPIDKVQKFYQERFPEMSVIQHHGRVEMHSVDGHSKRIIALRTLRGGEATEISLASVGEPKAN